MVESVDNSYKFHSYFIYCLQSNEEKQVVQPIGLFFSKPWFGFLDKVSTFAYHNNLWICSSLRNICRALQLCARSTR